MAKQYFPEFIVDFYIMLTERCPLRCEYCYIKDRGHGSIMSRTILDTLMDKIGLIKPRIIFFGGEPLLELETIKWFVNKYKRRVKSFQVVTSSIVFFNEFINEIYLQNREIFDLQISWDGFTDTRKLANGNNVAKRVFNNIQYMCESTDLPFQIRSVINDTNIDFFWNIYKHHAFNYEKYNNYFADFTIAHQSEFDYTFDIKLKYQLEIIFNHIHSLLLTKSDAIFIPQSILGLINGCINNTIIAGCNVGSEIIIRPNGDIYPCTMLSQIGDRFKMGNINSNNDLNTECIDELIQQPNGCFNCTYSTNCFGGCRYEKMVKGNSLNYINTNYCAQSKVLIDTTKKFVESLSSNILDILHDKIYRYRCWKSAYESIDDIDHKIFRSKI